MSSRGAAVAVSSLRHAFNTRAGELVVLDDITFTVAPGGYAALVGPSGAGKTTLLSIIGGLEGLQAGSVTVHGHDLANLEGDDLAAYRRDTVGFVFQHFGLLDALTAIENVELALVLDRADRRTRRRRAEELLDAVGLRARADHRPVELSGGERQRVAIAVRSPTGRVCSSPTSRLAISTRAQPATSSSCSRPAGRPPATRWSSSPTTRSSRRAPNNGSPWSTAGSR